jgi:putative addiction module killer protein
MEYEIRLTPAFADWMAGLDDDIAAAAVATRLLRVRRGLFGDHVSVGDRVSELRIHHGAGIRVYYTIKDRIVVFMLVGGTKRTQRRDIENAKSIERQL